MLDAIKFAFATIGIAFGTVVSVGSGLSILLIVFFEQSQLFAQSLGLIMICAFIISVFLVIIGFYALDIQLEKEEMENKIIKEEN